MRVNNSADLCTQFTRTARNSIRESGAAVNTGKFISSCLTSVPCQSLGFLLSSTQENLSQVVSPAEITPPEFVQPDITQYGSVKEIIC